MPQSALIDYQICDSVHNFTYSGLDQTGLNSQNLSANGILETALKGLPSKLVPLARNRFEELANLPDVVILLDQISITRAGQKILMSLPTVLASSDFISNSLQHSSGLMASLLDTDCVLEPRKPKTIKVLVSDHCSASQTVDELMSALRNLRRREIARLGWRDVAGFASLKEVFETLSNFADETISVALSMAYRKNCKQYGTPIGADSGKPVALVVLGVGKLGGRELNFSSDIDLLFAYREKGKTNGAKVISNQEFFTKVGHLLIRILDEFTDDGFVFRTDMRLRPNGRSGPLVLSFDAMHHYYITHGREWERYALIKARPVAGNARDGTTLLEILRPFIYRKYLDFSAFESLRSMKYRIERELLKKNSKGDLKLGRGGIREIEFIVQAHQLIRGGREKQLQTESIYKAIEALESLHLIDSAGAEELRVSYNFLRKIEHRLQAAEDRQTHQIPSDVTRQQQLAIASGFSDWPSFNNKLTEVLGTVHNRFKELLTPEFSGSDDTRLSEWADIWQNSIEADDATAILQKYGFHHPDQALQLLEDLRTSRFYHTFSRVGRDRLDRLIPTALSECAKTNNSMTALTRLISVIESIGRRSAYLSLLYENPVALSQLIKLITASRGICSWIKQHPVILDELLDPISSYLLESKLEISCELERKISVSKPDDLESLMDTLREFRQGYTLRLAAADIAGIISQKDVSLTLTGLAESILVESLSASVASLERNCNADIHGIGIIAYGKLGSYDLGYNSDLDLIFLFEPSIGSVSSDVYRYYNRILQRLIHVLTTRTRAGQLYDIDMRLRPDGRSGICINTIESFSNYQLHKAQVWEHQALTRGRMILGSSLLESKFNDLRRQILCLPRNKAMLRQSVIDMRERLIEANCRSNDAEYDLKIDRGGLLDIEFLLQYLILKWSHQVPALVTEPTNRKIIGALVHAKIFEESEASRLNDILSNYLAMENLLKLQERPRLIPRARFVDERHWVRSLWNRFLEQDSMPC